MRLSTNAVFVFLMATMLCCGQEACTTTGHHISDRVPMCSDLLGKWYSGMDKRGQFILVPLVIPPMATVFTSANKDNPNIINFMCLLSTAVPIEKSGCAQMGDAKGKCDIGDGVNFMWYGYGEKDMTKPAAPIQPDRSLRS